MRNKQEELGVCEQLEGRDLTGITKVRWGSSQCWSAAGGGHRLLSQDRLGGRGELYFMECLELCSGLGDELAESLWVRIRGQTIICCGLPGQGEDEDSQPSEEVFSYV